MFSESRAIYRTGVGIHWNRYPCHSGMPSHVIRMDCLLRWFCFNDSFSEICFEVISGNKLQCVNFQNLVYVVVHGLSQHNIANQTFLCGFVTDESIYIAI